MKVTLKNTLRMKILLNLRISNFLQKNIITHLLYLRLGTFNTSNIYNTNSVKTDIVFILEKSKNINLNPQIINITFHLF